MDQLAALLVIATVASVAADNGASPASTSTTPQPLQPVYKPPPPAAPFVPLLNYPYSDSYGLYDSPFYPQSGPAQTQAQLAKSEQEASSSYLSPVVPPTQGALKTTMTVLAKFTLFLLGGVSLLLIGGIFAAILCKFSPLCLIPFPTHIFGNLDQESMRSFITPDKISQAAALVQDAIGRYQRLQRAVS